MLSKLLEDLQYKQSIPNWFTIGMGELIREARKEAQMSQADLAEGIFRRQASISDIENGKREVTASELLYLSYTLNKPITYFIPEKYKRNMHIEENLSELERELLIQAKELSTEDMKRVIAQIKALSDLSL